MGPYFRGNGGKDQDPLTLGFGKVGTLFQFGVQQLGGVPVGTLIVGAQLGSVPPTNNWTDLVFQKGIPQTGKGSMVIP